MKKIKFYPLADWEVLEKAIIRSGLCGIVSRIERVQIVALNSKKKCVSCGRESCIKLVIFRYSSKKPYSQYYCYKCFFEHLNRYLTWLGDTLEKKIKNAIPKEILTKYI
ncbi:MAG TPA: hypothetical protein ENG66_01640 [Thermococcus sp.]|nr:hypothetical protein [Thermococcus sp.]